MLLTVIQISLFFHSNLLPLTTKKKEPLPHCCCTLSSKRREAEKSSEIHFLHRRDGLGWSGNYNDLVSFSLQAYLLFTFLNISIVKGRVLLPSLHFTELKEEFKI